MKKSRQGRRSGSMIMGSMCDISVRIIHPPEKIAEQTKIDRKVKATYLRLCRKYIFTNNWEQVKNCLVVNFPYDKKTKEKLRNLYNRLYR